MSKISPLEAVELRERFAADEIQRQPLPLLDETAPIDVGGQ